MDRQETGIGGRIRKEEPSGNGGKISDRQDFRAAAAGMGNPCDKRFWNYDADYADCDLCTRRRGTDCILGDFWSADSAECNGHRARQP